MEKFTRILLVDDDWLDRFIATKILEGMKIAGQINAVSSGLEALSYLMDDAQAYPELIFLDINMPGMNGFEFLEHCHKAGCLEGIEVILLSSSVHPEDRKRAKAFGVKHYLEKPLTQEKLGNILAQKQQLE